MHKALMTAAGAVLLLAAGSTVASAADDTTCRQLQSQVSTALDSNQQATNRDEAVKERNLGRDFCIHGYYKVGSDHLAQALKLLGAAPASQNG
jgi:hypothetical protein